MKEIVLGAMNELTSDLLELAHLRFEANDNDEHTFNALALRTQNLAELVKTYFEMTDEAAKNAVRWKFLFRTSGISFKMEDDKFVVTKDVVQGGRIVGSKMLASAESLPKAVDKFLGF